MKRWLMLAGAVTFGFVFQNCGNMADTDVHELEQKSVSHPFDTLKFLAEGADQVTKARQSPDAAAFKFSHSSDGEFSIIAEFEVIDPAQAGRFKISKAKCRYTTETAEDNSLAPSGVALPEDVDLGGLSAQSSAKWVTDCEFHTSIGIVDYHGEGNSLDSVHLGGASLLSKAKHRLNLENGALHEIEHIVRRYNLYGPTQDTSRVYQQATLDGKPANPVKASQFNAGFLLQGS